MPSAPCGPPRRCAAAIAEHGLDARIGVNTGEVVVGGQGETLVTGDAVNVAARLEQAAGAGETLIGAATRASRARCGSGRGGRAARAEGEVRARRGIPAPRGALRARRRSRGASRHRSSAANASGSGCGATTRTPWPTARAVSSRCSGQPGIGKSRLVADFLERVGDSSDVLRGRCLSYGEGITYWPLVEILISVGVEPESVIGTSPPETQLAFRRLLETRAAERPQVVVIDDLQWAEPVFVDLVEHVSDMSRDAPIFLLCIARTELLDNRPGWAGGKLNATSLLLEPLAAKECSASSWTCSCPTSRSQATSGSASRRRRPGTRCTSRRCSRWCDEHGGRGDVVVPPTIQALLQARIDSLDGDVRVVMERGSVEGEVFHRGSVAVLSPDPFDPRSGPLLATLVRKELIRSTPPTFPDDEGFRFRHLLIRDAAYESLPKATACRAPRALLRVALWPRPRRERRDHRLPPRAGVSIPRRARRLGCGARWTRASRLRNVLPSPGEGALRRGDFNAGRSLFGRATSLLPERDEEKLALAPEYADALLGVEPRRRLGRTVAGEGGLDPGTRAHAAVSMATLSQDREHASTSDDGAGWRNEAWTVFEESGDEYGLARYWWGVAMDSWFMLRVQETADACERALAHLERAGEPGARTEREGSRAVGHVLLQRARRRSTTRSSGFGPWRQASTASSRPRGRESTWGACTR